ncbi:MAG: gliding motility-associated C-terminal domain-containing protein, partial [Leeuwenhoekiella sp.]
VSDSADNIPDATYNLIFDLSGSNESSNNSATLSFVDGNASYNIPSDLLTNPGNTILTITNFQNTEAGCFSTGLPVSTSFEIYANPDITAANLTAGDICLGENANVLISGGDLADGDYEIIYQLSGENNAADNTVTILFTGGTGSFTIPSTQLSASGENSISITQITDLNVPNTCNVEVTDLSTTFTTNPLPVVDNLALGLPDAICLGDDMDVTLSDSTLNVTDGSYLINYELSGVNTSSQSTNLEFVDGSASFTIDSSLLVSLGVTTLNFTNFTNTVTSCSVSPTSLTGSVNIVSPPDLTAATLSFEDLCSSTGSTALLTAPNLADGNYTVVYVLAGANTGTQVSGTVNSIDGLAYIAIDPTALPNSGETSITLTTVTNSASNCLVEGLLISDDFTVYSLPEIVSDNIQITAICEGEDVNVQISETTLENGDYTIDYQVTGSNVTQATQIVSVLDGDASFSISNSQIKNPGSNIFTINAVTNNTTSCSFSGNPSTTFEVNPNPVLNDGEVSVLDSCFNENASVLFTESNGLADGNYTLTYDISGSNNSLNNTATIEITNANGSFEIPAALLTQTGENTLTITEIVSDFGCTSGVIAVDAAFEIIPLPDAQGITLMSSDICLFENAVINITGATALLDKDYILTYQLSGSNTSDAISQTVTFTAGTAIVDLSAAILQNAGATTFTLLDVQDYISMCSAQNLTASTVTITIIDPDPPTLESGGNVLCINDDPTISDLAANVSPLSGISWYASESDTSAISTSTPLVNGATYYASYTSEETGCESSVRLAITVDLTGCDNVFIPEGFSPNSDGINDYFEIQNIDIIYPKYTIEVFNRNGTVVFEGNANVPGWDGNSNKSRIGDNILPNGVYFYIINYNDGKTKPKQGKIYLNR